MKITLGNCYIESDKNQYILYEDRPKGYFPGRPDNLPSENEVVRDVIGYYSSLEECLISAPNRVIMRSEINTLKECIKEIRKYKAIIKEAIGEK